MGPGQQHDSKGLFPLLEIVSIKTVAGAGRPRTRPRLLIAERGYDARSLRRYLGKRGIKNVLPERRETERQRRRRGRPPLFCAESYKSRNVIERLVGWLKEHRRLATRFEKLASSFLAMLKLALILVISKSSFQTARRHSRQTRYLISSHHTPSISAMSRAPTKLVKPLESKFGVNSVRSKPMRSFCWIVRVTSVMASV